MFVPQYDYSPRRASLVHLYKNLHAQDDDDSLDFLRDAATNFPEEGDEVEETYCAPSCSSGGSSAPPFNTGDTDSDSESDSGSDLDSDVEPMNLDIDPQSDHVQIHDDAPFMPPRHRSPHITRPMEASPPCAPVSRVTSRVVAPQSRQQHRRSRPAVAAEDSDRDADCESSGDATDDEYVPSPVLSARKRPRSASPDRSRRSSASPAASLPSSTTSSQRPLKRARLALGSRNKQAASPAIIQRVANSAETADFTCPECGWKQENERMPDFKRHLKTHLRPNDEEPEKGWRCKGVLASDAAQYGVPSDEETYIFLDRERVGGCMKTFSRRDALKRHLDNSNVTCIGRPTTATEE
ncbi:hypothetical protein C8J57DRAFT_508526 [Mycena rebaudengoi]|nr:hypothetical protein C8J57DRAFT_508526 [Mycena rebaudengoi]